MKISHAWLQTYFDTPLPTVEEVADALTFHVFEIDERVGDMLDVKVLPDRAAYGLSHRGIAKELSAILNIPLKVDPLRQPLPAFASAPSVTLGSIDPKCHRYMAAVVKGVAIGPSPSWLREVLESVGQRSINNVVDATNYVLMNIGQPLHAFDAAKVASRTLGVREAHGEKITILGGTELAVTPGALLIVDGAGIPLGIAGVKGGQAAEITSTTTDIIIESANFDGTSIRKTAQSLKLFTDASLRFQNRISPELAAYGMRDVLALITDIAGGTVEGVVDFYPTKIEQKPVTTTTAQISGRIGLAYTNAQVEDVFTKLDLAFAKVGDVYSVTPPFERNDIQIPEDLAEEVGRIIGYDHVKGEVLPVTETPDQKRYNGIEHIKDVLIEKGFTEISTQSFAKKGDILLANPLDVEHPYLRTALTANMTAALEQAKHHAALTLKPKEKVKLFEVGSVFTKESEHLSLVVSEPVAELDTILGTKPTQLGTIAEYDLSTFDFEKYGAEYSPIRYELGMYHPFSIYPYVSRDIAVWTPEGTEGKDVQELILKNTGPLLARIDSFDQFIKEGRTSFAFRLVFQSPERTLTDVEVGDIMTKVSAALNAQPAWQVR